MIYQQASLIVNVKMEDLWQVLQQATASEEGKKFYPGCDLIEVTTHAEETTRILNFSNYTLKERVNLNFPQHRIFCTLEDHPFYQGELLFQCLRPSSTFLGEKHCTLIIISAWRMHPGIFAAPKIDKQDFIDEVARRIKEEAERLNNPTLF